MAQANLDNLVAGESASHVEALTRMNQFLRAGGSWSGREQNCLFLNIGARPFADISVASGFGLADDTRAFGLVDWDADGRLDVWMTNRTAPEIRFLRNAGNDRNHFLAVKLEGVSCNRDAIGARLELVRKDHAAASKGQQTSIKTLRAGEGYLGQSTKWIYFGLGATSEIERLVVRWPGGEREVFSGLAADTRYRILQGAGKAEQVVAVRRISLAPGEVKSPSPKEQARIVLVGRAPLLDAEYQSLHGEQRALNRHFGSPFLLNLWASWCPPCMKELAALAQNQRELRRAGVEVLALNIEALQQGEVPKTAPLSRLLDGLSFDFPSGMAGRELVGQLEVIQAAVLNQDLRLPLPSSFLIDAGGRVAVIYKGPITIETLLDDIRLLQAPPAELRNTAVPLAGRWCTQPVLFDPLTVAQTFFERGATAQAARYVKHLLENRPPRSGRTDLLPDYRDNTQVRHFLASLLSEMGDGAGAVKYYEDAWRLGASSDTANNLAWILAAHHDRAIRDPARAVALAEHACSQTEHQNAMYVDTLAVAYASAGRFPEAIEAAQKAIALARAAGAGEMTEKARARLQLFTGNRPYRDPP